MKDRPKKVAGCYWEGKKTSFDDGDGECSADSGGLTEQRESEDIEPRSKVKCKNVEKKIKLKKLCKKILRQVYILNCGFPFSIWYIYSFHHIKLF